MRSLWQRIGADDDQLQRLQSRRERFQALFREGIKQGDDILFDYIPDNGTSIRINGHTRTTIAGSDFYEALLRVWIGKNPVSSELKSALLGS